MGYPKMGSPPFADQNFIKTAGTVNPVSGKYWSAFTGVAVTAAVGSDVATGVLVVTSETVGVVSPTEGELIGIVPVAVGDGVWP
jgi:hypothetical protein